MGLFDDDSEKTKSKGKKEEKTYTLKEIQSLFKVFRDAVKDERKAK